MRRRIAPSTVLTVGLGLASVAFVMWAVESTVIDRGPLHREAEQVLAESPSQQAMRTRLTAAIVATAAVDPATVDALVTRALEQPEFVAAFAGALEGVQEHVVDGAVGPITLDPTLVTEAVRASAADAQAAAALATIKPLVIQLPEDEIPNLAQWADLWEAVLRVLALVGVLLATYGVIANEHRVWAAGRVGRWAIVLGVATVVVFWVVPRFVVRPLGGWIGVGGVVAGASEQLVPVALGLVVVGALVVIGAHRWEASDRKRVLSSIPHAPSRSTRSTATAAAPSTTRWESPV